MPQSNKIWKFPSIKDDILPHMINGSYQDQHRKKILNFLKENNCKFRNCCDIGAHIGIWSFDFVEHFKWVHAFEPITELRQCYEKNVTGSNYTLYPFGLGNSNEEITFHYDPKRSGGTQVNATGNYTAEIRRLDDLSLSDIDYIKIDAEGYELEILKGGINLLKNQSPIVHLEMKLKKLLPFNLTKHYIRNWLSKLNYKQVLKIVNEYVFVKDV